MDNITSGSIDLYTTTNWTSFSGPTTKVSKGTGGAWDDFFVRDTHVIKVGATYYLFYAGQIDIGGGATTHKIGYATSSSIDGTYTKYGSNPIITGAGVGVNEPSVHYDPSLSAGAAWQMFVTSGAGGGKDDLGAQDIVRYTASAPDGTWTSQGVVLNPYQDQEQHVEFKTFVMPLNPNVAIAPVEQVISSDNGITWAQISTDDLLSAGGAGQFDDNGVYAPTLVLVGTTWHMVYQGNDGSLNSIGHATAPRLHRWFPTDVTAFEMPGGYLRKPTTGLALDWECCRSEYPIPVAALGYILGCDVYAESEDEAGYTFGILIAQSSSLFYSILVDPSASQLTLFSHTAVTAGFTQLETNTSITIALGTWYRVRARVTPSIISVDWFTGTSWREAVLVRTGLTLAPARVGPMAFSFDTTGNFSRWRNLFMAAAEAPPVLSEGIFGLRGASRGLLIGAFPRRTTSGSHRRRVI